MKKIISILFCVLTPISLFLIDRYWINQPVQAPVAMDYAEQLKLDDRKNFVTAAQTPLAHYQEHLSDIEKCKNFISWLASNRKARDELANHLSSSSREGVSFLQASKYATHPVVLEVTNAKGRIDIYSDFHEVFGDANLEDIQCKTKAGVRLWKIEDFGRQVADAQDNPYGSPTIETLKVDLREIKQRYAEVFFDEIKKSISQCQRSIYQSRIATPAKSIENKDLQAKAQSWIAQLENVK
jgi:hypothetical protein